MYDNRVVFGMNTCAKRLYHSNIRQQKAFATDMLLMRRIMEARTTRTLDSGVKARYLKR